MVPRACTMFKIIGLTRRSLRSIALVIAGLLIISFTLAKLKYLYYTHQKFNRLQTYKEYMDEVAHEMSDIETSSNKSFAKLERLNTIMENTLTNNPASLNGGER